MTEYRDDRTGARVRDLTPNLDKAQVFYQTHPMWTEGREYFLFQADAGGKSLPHALLVKTGEIRPLTETDAGATVLDAKQRQFYCLHGRDIDVIDVVAAFGGKTQPRRIASLPEAILRPEGGLTLDARGDVLYTGAVLEDGKKWGIYAVDIATGSWRKVTDVDFKVGHFQANPETSGLVMFCYETGGDAPQRTWVVDVKTGAYRPFYKETYNEWVTHEVWWGKDRAAFTVWPYDEEHKKKPHGVLSADLATGTPTVYSQYPAWHTHGSPDGQWLVGDDFDRNVWLIKAETRERRLLTQGHLGKGFDTHPHPSFTPDSKAVVFTSSRGGKEHIFLVEIPEWASLPLP